MNSFITVKEDEQKKLIQGLEEEKINLTRKLRITQKLLDEQLEKINAHVSILIKLECYLQVTFMYIQDLLIIRSSSDSNSHSYDFPQHQIIKEGFRVGGISD